MPVKTPRRPDDLAAAIADGADIDWAILESTGDFTADELRAFQTLDTVRRAHRDGPRSAIETGFEVLEHLGSGASASVYRARDLSLDREVALKVLNASAFYTPEARQRFVREARLLAKLDHPGIVRVHSIDEREGKVRISLELVEGATLADLVRRSGPLAPAEAARVGIELCRSLAVLHGRGLVHRDVKPANVMRAEGGRIVLLDFGLARLGEGEADLARTAVAGTPLFMAPEQFDSSAPLEPSVDIYALGVLLYWLVCGQYPYEARSVEDLRGRLAAGRPIPLVDRRSDVPPGFVDVVTRAMAADPGERFDSAGEMESALRDSLLGGRRPPRGKHLLLAGAAAVALAATFLFVGPILSGSRGLVVDFSLHLQRDPGTVELRTGDTVRVHDALFGEIECPEDCHLYVFNEDNEGLCFTLFPLEGYDLGNPLPGGKRFRIPGAVGDTQQDWVVNTPGGGVEHVYVLVSRGPDARGEHLLRRLPQPREGSEVSYHDLDEEDKKVLYRGIGATRPASGTAVETAPYPLQEYFRQLEEGASDVFVRRYRLHNDS